MKRKKMKYPNYNGIEYKPNEDGIAEEVKCPLVDDWIFPEDCMENQDVADEYIPEKYKKKKDWRKICNICPFQND